MRPLLAKIISGGQTGVDRAGLDAAMEAGIPSGGFCPKGRLAEDGTIPARYPQEELEAAEYTVRTERNVVESDGTLILNVGELSGGTLHTLEYARKHARPWLIVQLDAEHDATAVTRWIADQKIRVLNIAGPRESKCPGLHDKALTFLRTVFTER